MRGKVVKDGSDILALLDPQPKGAQLPDAVSYPKLRRLARRHDVGEVVAETVKEVIEDDQEWQSYGRRFNASGIRKVFSRE